MNLPVKRPFKKMFMSEEDKQIYSMVQRLGNLEKSATKDKRQKLELKQQRDAKKVDVIQAKRDQHSKQNRIDRYKIAQGGRSYK